MFITNENKTHENPVSITITWSVVISGKEYSFPNARAAAQHAIIEGGTLLKTVIFRFKKYDKVGRYHDNPFHVLPPEEAKALRDLRLSLVTG